MLRETGASHLAGPEALEELDAAVRIGGGRRLRKDDEVPGNAGIPENAGIGDEAEAGPHPGRHDEDPCRPLSRSSLLPSQPWAEAAGAIAGPSVTTAPPPRDSQDLAALDDAEAPPLGVP